MDNEDGNYNSLLETEEDDFLGLLSDRLPRLNFHHLMESNNPFNNYSHLKLDFSPLVKKTPFEKEKSLKTASEESPADLQTQISNEESSIEECELPRLLKVAFWDQLPLNMRYPLFSKSGATGTIKQNGRFSTYPKGIIKAEEKRRFKTTYINKNFSHNTRTVSTQATLTPGMTRRSLFKRLNEIAIEVVKLGSEGAPEAEAFINKHPELSADKSVTSKTKKTQSPPKTPSKKT